MPRDRAIESKAVLTPYLIRPGRPSLRTTFQLRVELRSIGGKDAPAAYDDAVALSARWLQRKFAIPLPAAAFDGKSFEMEIPGQTVEAVALGDRSSWSARLTQPDAPFADRPAVAGRTWTTEIGLARRESKAFLSLRVVCASLPFAVDAIAFTRPRLVAEIATRAELWDVARCSSVPWVVSSDADLERLKALITDRSRGLSVFVLSQPDQQELGLRVRPYLLDELRLARGLLGLGHVVCLPAAQSYRWTELMGKPWSVYRGAVRTYRPGLDLANDSPTSHPLAVATRILAYYDAEGKAEDAFSRFLVEQAFLDATQRRIDIAPCLSLNDALLLAAQGARRESTDAAVIRVQYEKEIGTLKDTIEKLEKEAEAYNDDAIAAERERDHYIEEYRRLRAVADGLRQALSARTGETPDAKLEYPKTFDDLPDWVGDNLAGRLELHPRARQPLKDATYENPELAYRALLLLAGAYRDMRLGHDGARERWEEGLKELELRFGGAISEKRAGEQGDEYFVRYPIYSNRRRFLEYHVRKGASKDQRYCLSIYFFWDDDGEQVVVGWLPSHLDNRMT